MRIAMLTHRNLSGRGIVRRWPRAVMMLRAVMFFMVRMLGVTFLIPRTLLVLGLALRMSFFRFLMLIRFVLMCLMFFMLAMALLVRLLMLAMKLGVPLMLAVLLMLAMAFCVLLMLAVAFCVLLMLAMAFCVLLMLGMAFCVLLMLAMAFCVLLMLAMAFCVLLMLSMAFRVLLLFFRALGVVSMALGVLLMLGMALRVLLLKLAMALRMLLMLAMAFRVLMLAMVSWMGFDTSAMNSEVMARAVRETCVRGLYPLRNATTHTTAKLLHKMHAGGTSGGDVRVDLGASVAALLETRRTNQRRRLHFLDALFERSYPSIVEGTEAFVMHAGPVRAPFALGRASKIRFAMTFAPQFDESGRTSEGRWTMNDTVVFLFHPCGSWGAFGLDVVGGRFTATSNFTETGRTNH